MRELAEVDWYDVDALEDAWLHRDDPPLDDARLDELAELDGWSHADDAWWPGDELVEETVPVDYDGAGTYADPAEDDEPRRRCVLMHRTA